MRKHCIARYLVILGVLILGVVMFVCGYNAGENHVITQSKIEACGNLFTLEIDGNVYLYE